MVGERDDEARKSPSHPVRGHRRPLTGDLGQIEPFA